MTEQNAPGGPPADDAGKTEPEEKPAAPGGPEVTAEADGHEKAAEAPAETVSPESLTPPPARDSLTGPEKQDSIAAPPRQEELSPPAVEASDAVDDAGESIGEEAPVIKAEAVTDEPTETAEPTEGPAAEPAFITPPPPPPPPGDAAQPTAPAAGPKAEYDTGDPINSFIDTWLAIVTDPAAFFKRMPRLGDYGNPAVFAIICLFINAVGSVIANAGTGGISGLIATAIGSIIFLFFSAFVLWVMTLIFGGKGGYETSFRILAYSSAVAVFTWIPLVGFFAWLYQVYLQVIGVKEAHEMSTGSAVAAVLLPALLTAAVIFATFIVGVLAALGLGLLAG